MFEKTLTDMVKGIRAHKKDEARYIAACLRECKEELAQNDKELKAEALLKLAYRQMFGHQMPWAAFDCGEEGAREALRMERTVGAILGEAPAERARELRDIGRDSRSGTVTLLPNDHWAHGGALTEESASPERSQPRPRGMQRERSREVQHDLSLIHISEPTRPY